MPVKVNLTKVANSVEREVKGDFGSFYVTIKRPTAIERTRSLGASLNDAWEDIMQFRLSLVTGWRELLDQTGQPVPFNEMTKEAVYANHAILNAILDSVSRYLNESPSVLTEDERGNSEGQPQTIGWAAPPTASA